MDEGLPPGFRFHPSDEELLTYYLTRKVADFEFVTKAISDVDLNKCEPWDLPGKASLGEKVGYFFSMKDRKYPTGMRTNRATNAGYWKTTGKDKEIFHYGILVGMKKTLVFYKGRAPKGEKTSWVMHEYRLQTEFPYKPSKEEWVVCKIFKKSNNFHMKKPSSSFPSMLLESSGNMLNDQFGDMDVSILNNVPDSSDHFNPMLQLNDGTDSANVNDRRINEANKMNLKLYMNLLYGSNYQPNESINGASSMSTFVGNGDGFVRPQEFKFADLVQQQQQQEESIWRGY